MTTKQTHRESIESSLVAKLGLAFKKHSDSTIAAAQAKYMKNLFIFYGLPTTTRRALQKQWFIVLSELDQHELRKLIRLLWEQKEREYHYVAIELAKKFQKKLMPDFIGDIEHMIRTNSWWDTVDFIAKELLGTLLAKNPTMQNLMDQWIRDEHMWIRRSALLYQLSYKQKTDTHKLFQYCILTMHEKEFFIRKAIGWVLRQYSRTDPVAVRAFVEQHEHALSGLSKREALKYC